MDAIRTLNSNAQDALLDSPVLILCISHIWCFSSCLPLLVWLYFLFCVCFPAVTNSRATHLFGMTNQHYFSCAAATFCVGMLYILDASSAACITGHRGADVEETVFINMLAEAGARRQRVFQHSANAQAGRLSPSPQRLRTGVPNSWCQENPDGMIHHLSHQMNTSASKLCDQRHFLDPADVGAAQHLLQLVNQIPEEAPHILLRFGTHHCQEHLETIQCYLFKEETNKWVNCSRTFIKGRRKKRCPYPPPKQL
ncbi:uncharacterized protein LOC133541538 [Nerophis ophidion]|uniref:uncharacterized protein LOC133541538 n=1 Tax=Nerophis ophidion TaxID=159077 RepID=UPI002ADF10A7|nr:uncharacterized protein LOC133541538 [Nerophis ophidion]